MTNKHESPAVRSVGLLNLHSRYPDALGQPAGKAKDLRLDLLLPDREAKSCTWDPVSGGSRSIGPQLLGP